MLEIFDQSILAWSPSSAALTKKKHDLRLVMSNQKFHHSRKGPIRQTRTGRVILSLQAIIALEGRHALHTMGGICQKSSPPVVAGIG